MDQAEIGQSYPAYDSHGRRVLLEESYKLAADALVERRRDGTLYEKCVLVYPILFLYRHYLELGLKYLVETYGMHFNQEPNRSQHNLRELWEPVRSILESTDSSDQKGIEGIEGMENIVTEFSKIDPTSFTFRYPTDKKGQLNRIPFEQIDPKHVARVMEGVHNFFWSADGLLNEYVSHVAEVNGH